jgi:hypothetical protein
MGGLGEHETPQRRFLAGQNAMESKIEQDRAKRRLFKASGATISAEKRQESQFHGEATHIPSKPACRA